MRLDHEPGRRMEFDFGQVQVDYPEGRRTTHVLIGIWTFSNCPFLIALPSQRSESILEGMKSAFEFFGCVSQEVWWDNPKAVTVEILRGRDRTLNPTYAALASHYCFAPMFCMPARGQEKSDVERTVFALQRRFATPVPCAAKLEELNRHLLACCLKERRSILITSNLPFGEWGQVFQGERMTAALLDRFTHRCHIFEMNGESYRFRESSKLAKEKKATKETK